METTGIIALFALTLLAAISGYALSLISRAVLVLENLPKGEALMHELMSTRHQVQDLNQLVRDIDKRVCAIDEPTTPKGFAPPGMYMPGGFGSSDPNQPAGSLVPITAAMKVTNG